MGSLPGGGVCPVEGVVGVCPACPDGGGGERERGAVAPQNPGHLLWVTRYSMFMLSHDQGRQTLEPPAVAGGPWTSQVFLTTCSS